MTMNCDEVVELDDVFAELLDADATDVTARFDCPDEDSLEFDLCTPCRWSNLPFAPPAPQRSNVIGVEAHLIVHDAAAAIAFYAHAFGAIERVRQALPDGRVVAAVLVLGGFTMHLSDDLLELRGGRHGAAVVVGATPLCIHLAVDGVDPLFARAVAAGASVRLGLHHDTARRRHGVVEDPFGHRWSLSSPAAS